MPRTPYERQKSENCVVIQLIHEDEHATELNELIEKQCYNRHYVHCFLSHVNVISKI
jgi:hypothetical protein